MAVTKATELQKRAGELSDVAQDHQRPRKTEQGAIRALKTAELPDETVAALAQADLSHLPSDQSQ